MTEPVIHSNAKNIPVEELEKMRGYYHYSSHRLLKTLQILKEVQQEYNEDGSPTRFRTATEYTLTKDQIQEMESLLSDLEHRLRKMFVVDEKGTGERMRQLHAAGKIPKRGKKRVLTLHPHKLRGK